eukprot:360291-Chlamydomonas_euryale.AAC.7
MNARQSAASLPRRLSQLLEVYSVTETERDWLMGAGKQLHKRGSSPPSDPQAPLRRPRQESWSAQSRAQEASWAGP